MLVNMSVAMLTTLCYPGVLGGPALIGWITYLSDLYVAFFVVVAVFLIITLGAYTLQY
ncbi:hypothetical protein YEEN111655_13760 [Yersinia entomophaga]|nr:hypothetical protein [Yersinia sp. IP36721]